MTYNVQAAIDNVGKEAVLKKIFEEGINQVELHQFLGLSKSDSRMSQAVYKRIFNALGIDGLPYPKLPKDRKVFKILCDKAFPNYWDNERLVYLLLKKLNDPVINVADGRVRGVISFGAHPKANSDSQQVKAHVVAWEIYNKMYVPDNHWVVPLDDDYLNLSQDNLVLVNTTEYKSDRFSGTGNPSYKNGTSRRAKIGGWDHISKERRLKDGKCTKCSSVEDLVVHHIINYHLFSVPIEAHQPDNLITLCRSCHTKLHAGNLSIKQDLIAEMRYSKLIELLETLKSQVPDSLMETYREVEKQLGLTDNQQPSP